MYDVKVTTSKASSDCGAACMVSFLAYYGIDITLEEARKECNTRISGCTGKDLLTCGRKHGLDMRAWKELEDGETPETPDAVINHAEILKMDRPGICWWKFNHWIIFCGVDDRGKVIIMNPTRGRYSISESLFKAFYSGVLITNGEPQELLEE